MCSSSQSNASQLLAKFARRIWEFVSDDKDIVYLIKSIQSTSYPSLRGNHKGLLSSLNENSNATSYEHALDLAGNLSLLHDDETSNTIDRARKLVKELGYREGLHLKSKVEQKLNRYLSLTSLFVECLQVSSVDNRAGLEDMALMDYTPSQ